jgi:hypothetical protein
MSTAIAEPVVEAEVLTALDFDTPPVEVSAPPATPPFKVGFVPDNLKITWAPSKEALIKEPLTFEDIEQQMAALKVSVYQCGCFICTQRVGSTGPMNPTAKTLWVEAMRSKEYPQGRGALHQGRVWCALGVLIEVAIKAGVQVTKSIDPSTGATGYDGQFGSLPVSVQRWAGLNGNPNVIGSSVAMLNDGGMPFEQIADLVEANL